MSLIYYSNTIVNPIVYSLRIPELKQALALCCSRKQTEIIVKGKEGRIKMAAAMDLALLAASPATRLSLQADARLMPAMSWRLNRKSWIPSCNDPPLIRKCAM